MWNISYVRHEKSKYDMKGTMTERYDVEIHTALTSEFREVWQHLWETSAFATVYNSPSWFESALEAFEYKQIKIIAIYDSFSGLLVAVIPLIKTTMFGVSIYAPAGVDFVERISALIDFTNKEIVMEFVAQSKKLGVVYMCGLTDAELYQPAAIAGVSSLPVYQECTVDFSKGPYGEFSVQSAARLIRKTERTAGGPVTLRASFENHAENLALCFEIDQKSSKHEKGKGTFYDHSARKFYTLLAEKSPSSLSIYIISIANKPAAYSIQFTHKSVSSGSQKGYLTEYKKFNPGYLTYIKLFEVARERQYTDCNFGKGVDDFKLLFTKDVRQLYSLVISKKTFIRWYISILIEYKELAYTAISKNPNLYLKYKKLKKVLTSLVFSKQV